MAHFNQKEDKMERDKLMQTLNSPEDSVLEDSLKQLWEQYDEPYLVKDETNEEIIAFLDSRINKKIKFYNNWWFRAVAVVAICSLVWFGAMKYDSSFTEQQYLAVSASEGERSRITLPDGSLVWLNSNSELLYPTNFSEKSRKIQLKGEAYFEVNKLDKQNFVVKLNGIEIEVLGTKFYVSSNDAKSDINVVLKEGSIQINDLDTQEPIKILQPKDKFIFSKEDKEWKIEKCDPTLETLWLSNSLRFSNSPAKEMFEKLERWYNVKIVVENIPEDIHYGFTLKEESLNDALLLINSITPISFTINKEDVLVVYKNKHK